MSVLKKVAPPLKPGLGQPLKLRQALEVSFIHFLTPILLLVVLHGAAYFNSRITIPRPIDLLLGPILASSILGLLSIIAIQFYHVAFTDKSKSPLKSLLSRLKSILSNRSQMMAGIPIYLSMIVFMFAFSAMKVNINNFTPFSWDAAFDAMDQKLHFGFRPWELLQPVFGNAIGTFILSVNYNVWFFIINIFWVYFAFFTEPGEKRTHFYLSFVSVWVIGGVVVAILLSSAGPCYYGYVVTGENPYAFLMAQLNSFNATLPIWAVDTQTLLWEAHDSKSAFGGISAMPSMHNATTLLFVFASWHGPKLWRNLLIVHAILIFLGSIHLGWHYAVDAYLAWIITILIWFALKPVAAWWEAKPHVKAFGQVYVRS